MYTIFTKTGRIFSSLRTKSIALKLRLFALIMAGSSAGNSDMFGAGGIQQNPPRGSISSGWW